MKCIGHSFARWCLMACWLGLTCSGTVSADEKNGRLDIYFIDVEGGAATLFVTPAGETMLVDSGYPDNNGRDRDRILKVLKETAGKQQNRSCCRFALASGSLWKSRGSRSQRTDQDLLGPRNSRKTERRWWV
jgi:hypothetical protein